MVIESRTARAGGSCHRCRRPPRAQSDPEKGLTRYRARRKIQASLTPNGEKPMPRLVGFVANGCWVTHEVPDPVRVVEPVVEVVKVPMVPTSFDDCTAMVAAVVAAASRLPFKDQQRVR